MIFVFTLLSLLFLPTLSLKEIKPKRCINFKRFIEESKINKYSLLIKEQINDVYSLVNAFGKMYTEKYSKKCIFNEKDEVKEIEIEEVIEKDEEIEEEKEVEKENKN